MAVCGYLDRWSYLPGDQVRMHLDTEGHPFSFDLISLDSPGADLPAMPGTGYRVADRPRRSVRWSMSQAPGPKSWTS